LRLSSYVFGVRYSEAKFNWVIAGGSVDVLERNAIWEI
jgi:hypothetical protein